MEHEACFSSVCMWSTGRTRDAHISFVIAGWKMHNYNLPPMGFDDPHNFSTEGSGCAINFGARSTWA